MLFKDIIISFLEPSSGFSYAILKVIILHYFIF